MILQKSCKYADLVLKKQLLLILKTVGLLNILVSNIFMNKNFKETAFEISCETRLYCLLNKRIHFFLRNKKNTYNVF